MRYALLPILFLASTNASSLQLPPSGAAHFGCFPVQGGILRSKSSSEGPEACRSACLGGFYGVEPEVCICLGQDPPSGRRISLNECKFVQDVDQDDVMDVYFGLRTNDGDGECEATEAIQDVLVGQDKTPQGLDLITGEFKERPFDLYADGCGTNMYKIFTENIGVGNQLRTEATSVSSFVSEQSQGVAASVKVSASAGGSFFKGLVSASGSVSLGASFELNQLMSFEGSQETQSAVTEAMGVISVAEMVIENFENKRHFATFTSGFRRQLLAYMRSGFSEKAGMDILRTFGQFVPVRGLFGGYFRARNVLDAQSVSQSTLSERELEVCFESSVEAQASGLGFSASGRVEAAGCTDTFRRDMASKSASFMRETDTTSFFGGRVRDGVFDVRPEESGLLLDSKLYPNGKALELRMLSDFIKYDRVSPLELLQFGPDATNEVFDKTHEELEALIVRVINAAGDVLDKCPCNSGDLKSLRTFELASSVSGSKIECQCHPQIESINEVKVSLPGKDRILTLCEVELLDKNGNAIIVRGAEQSSLGHPLGDPEHAIDGNTNSQYFGGSCTHTKTESNPFWKATFFAPTDSVKTVRLINRRDCCSERLDGVVVELAGKRFDNVEVVPPKAEVKLTIPGDDKILSVCEVQLFDANNKLIEMHDPVQTSLGNPFGDPEHAIDGNTNSNFFSQSCTHTRAESNPAWRAAIFANPSEVKKVKIFNRGDCCQERLADVQVFVGGKRFTNVEITPRLTEIEIVIPGNDKVLTLCEVRAIKRNKGFLGIIKRETLKLFGASQSSLGHPLGDASHAIDGNTNSNYFKQSCTHTKSESNPSWRAFTNRHENDIDVIQLFNREDCCSSRLSGVQVFVNGKRFTKLEFE